MDYVHRGEALSNLNIIDFFVNTYEADIDKTCQHKSMVIDDETDLLRGPKRWGKPFHERVRYLTSHPKYKSKLCIVWSQHHNTLPNFIGQYFACGDDEEQKSFYYASMLTLLKPWRDLRTDLKHPNQTWEEAFNIFCSFASPRELRILSNIQYFHKCEAAAKCNGFNVTV